MASMLAPYAHFSDFHGRMPRGPYWSFVLFQLGVAIALLFASVLVTDDPDIPLGVVSLWLFFNLLPTLSAQVRRLHDTGRSGWLSLVALIPLIGPIMLLVLLLQPSVRRDPIVQSPPHTFGATEPSAAPAPELPTTTPNPAKSFIAELERLGSLKAQGLLTEAEFSDLKNRIIRGNGASA